MSVDNALELVGEFGKYQFMLLALLWLARTPLLLPVLLTYFTAYNPPWRCAYNSSICTSNSTFTAATNGYKERCAMPRSEWEFTQPKSFSVVTQFDLSCDRGILIYVASSIFFIAWAIGAVPMGWLSDRFGRKIVSFPCLFLSMASIVISVFSPNIWMYIICRFFNGFFTPGAFVALYMIGAELVGPRQRPVISTFFSFSFTASFVLLGIKAYFIRDWKILSLVCVLPYSFVFFFYRWIPESFRWLRTQGRNEECIAILHKVAEINGKKNVSFKEKLFEENGCEMQPHRVSILAVLWPSHVMIRTTIQLIGWFASGLVFYGVTLAADNLGGDLYRDFLISSCVTFPGAMLSLFLCKRYGRKVGVVPTLLFTSFVLAVVAMLPERSDLNAARSFLGTSGKLSVACCFTSFYLWSIELNSTVTRSLSMGLFQFVTRVGASASPWVAKGLRHYSVSSPFVLMSVLCVVTAFACYFLPETKDRPTIEVPEDMDRSITDKSDDSSDIELESTIETKALKL